MSVCTENKASHVPQILSGHENVIQYLHWNAKKDRYVYNYGYNCVDSADHTLFRWQGRRTENIVNLMLEKANDWNYLFAFIEIALGGKKSVPRRRNVDDCSIKRKEEPTAKSLI